MRAMRVLPVLVVAALLVGLASWWAGTERPTPSGLRRPVLAAAVGDQALSSTWYCAAHSVQGLDDVEHSLVLANPSDEAVAARLTAYGAEGEHDAQVVELDPDSTTRVSVGATFGAHDRSVLVESASGELAVEHRLNTASIADQAPCATASSDQWYFPALTTTRVGDLENTARLVLFNPFSSDAGVDISAAVEDGIRVPPEWAGLVVPAGSSRVVDLGGVLQRRELLSLSVSLRSGRVIAETVQTSVRDDRVAAARLQVGVPSPAPRWDFAAGFTGPGARERLVVHNPGEAPASVVVQVTPVGGAELAPEPFELEVTGRRYRVIDLNDEGRVPTVGLHSIQVETDPDTPVVVGRVNELTAARPEPEDSDGEGADDDPGTDDEGGGTADGGEPQVELRPDLDRGASISTGSPLASTRWVVPYLIVGGDQDPLVVVHNPGADPVRVSVESFGSDDPSALVADEMEVPAGDGVVLRLAGAELPDGPLALRVRSTSPVLVERVLTFAEQRDLSVGVAVPYPPPGGGAAFPLISEL